MAFYASKGNLIEFLDSQATGGSSGFQHSTNGLCLVTGSIAKRNLRDALTRRDNDAEQMIHISTIEDTAQRLLSGGTDTPPRIVDRQLLLEILKDLIEDTRSGDGPEELEALIGDVRFTEDLLETFLAELDQYYRASNAGADHETLAAVAESIDDAFISDRSVKALAAFRAVTASIESTLEGQSGLHLSRSHLVRTAAEHVSERWKTAFSDVDWVAVKTVNVFDNPTLRFFEALDDLDAGPDIYVFFERGTRERLRERFNNTEIDVQEPPEFSHSRPEFIEDLVAIAAADQPSDPTALLENEAVNFVEAPENRREVEQVLRHVDRLRSEDGCSLSDILLVAEDAGTYRAVLEDICATHEIPAHVETRRPIAQTVPYRYLKSALDLIGEVAKPGAEQKINYWELVDPIRLGYCPPSERSTEWPLDDKEFLRLEERLYQSQRDNTLRSDIGEGARNFQEWAQIIDENNGAPWDQLDTFLNWITDQAESPPSDGSSVESLLRELLRSHEFHTASRPIRSTSGPIIDTARFDVNTKHQTSIVRRIDENLGGVRRYFDISTDIDHFRDPSWDLAAEALGQELGNQSYGHRNADINGLKLVDAANAYFLDADHVFVLGTSAGTFPTDPLTPTFFNQAFYERVWETACTPTNTPSSADTDTVPYLYFPSHDFQFRQSLDAYEAGLSAANDSVTILRHYRDSDDYAVPWSPFVDPLPFDEVPDAVEHIQLGQWIASPDWYGDWATTTMRAPMRDRLRLALFHLRDGLEENTYVPRMTTEPLDTEVDLLRLLTSVDGKAFTDSIAPQYRRFTQPITNISVSESENAFQRGAALNAVIGEPHHAHELDIYSQCPLKYYFSQVLFGVLGGGAERGLPEQTQPVSSYSYDRIPSVTQLHYATNQTREAMEKIITKYLPNRQADLNAYCSVRELRNDFEDWVDEDDAVNYSVFQAVVSEYLVAEQEQAAGISRDWEWEDDPALTSVRGHEVQLPSHRRDLLPSKGATIRVFHSGEAGGARAALKQCFEPADDDGERPTDHEEICSDCAILDQCSGKTKFVHDHRARTVGAEGSADGVMVIDTERSAPTARQGEVSTAVEECLEPVEREKYSREPDVGWNDSTTQWRSQMGEQLSEMSGNDGTVEYEIADFFPDSGRCEGCEFRELCQVPLRSDDGGDNS